VPLIHNFALLRSALDRASLRHSTLDYRKLIDLNSAFVQTHADVFRQQKTKWKRDLKDRADEAASQAS
jgi:hypothetical protein